MTINFRFKAIESDVCSSVSTYSSSDFALEVTLHSELEPMSLSKKIDIKYEIKNKKILVIFGGIVFSFVGSELFLESIDSYTNKKNWLLQKVAPPLVVERARFSIDAPLDDDKYLLDCNPQYVLDYNKNILLIKLNENNHQKFYRIANNLTIGVNENSLVSVFIENIKII